MFCPGPSEARAACSVLLLCPCNKQFQSNKHCALVKSSVENMPSQTAVCKVETGINEGKVDSVFLCL